MPQQSRIWLRRILGILASIFAAALTPGLIFGLPLSIGESVDELFESVAMFSLIAMPFVLVGFFLFGIPSLILAKRMARFGSCKGFLAFGTIMGGLSAFAIGVALDLYAQSRGIGGNALFILLGLPSGLAAAAVWWHLVEKFELGTESG